MKTEGKLARISYGGETKRLELKIRGCFRHSFPVNHFHVESLETPEITKCHSAEMAGTGEPIRWQHALYSLYTKDHEKKEPKAGRRRKFTPCVSKDPVTSLPMQ